MNLVNAMRDALFRRFGCVEHIGVIKRSSRKNRGLTMGDTSKVLKFDEQHSCPRNLQDLEAVLRRGETIPDLTITPSVAAAVLESWNEGNRRRNEIDVQRYRRDMESDRWLGNGEIGFGVFPDSIRIGNGQHRMAAQVASGTTQRYNARVFTDADDYSAYVLTCDGGKNRSLADELRIFGIADSPGAASTWERVVNAMHAFLGAKAARLSKQERMDFALKYVKAVRYVLGLPKRAFKAHLLASIALAHSKRAKAVEDFVSQVISGAELTAGSPALVLDKALPEMNAARDFKAKDRAMGRMLRAMHDGVQGKRRTTIERAQANSQPMIDAITALVSAQAASAWVERQNRAAGK